MQIRSIRPSDAARFLRLVETLYGETEFTLLEPGESGMTKEQMRRRIQVINARENQTTLVVEDEGDLVGFVGVWGGIYRRSSHRANLAVGILQSYVGQGIGTRLFEEAIEWAAENKIHRLELTVMTHNPRGLALYRKMGFQIEGIKQHSLFINGRYVDEYYMARLLP